MPTAPKKKTKKIVEDPLSSSGVSSLSGISSYNIRKISIYKNGDRFHRGVKFVINPRVIKDMEPLLNQVNDRIQLSHGAKKLYSVDGKHVTSIKELEDGKIYVAASAQFIPMRYGEFTERVWKPPSRKHSPIMSADRIKTARTRSQEPGKRRQQQQNVEQMSAGSGVQVQRSRSVRTLTEDRKARRDGSRGTKTMNGAVGQGPPIPKRPDMIRPKVGPKKVEKPKPIPTNKKPPTPKRGVNKKVLGAAMGAGVAVVGAAALGVAAGKKTKPATPKPIPTAVSDISTASSVIPPPNVSSSAAEILEFPEEEKKVDMATIHRTPTPPTTNAPISRSNSIKSTKSVGRTASTPAAERQPTPESSEEEEEEEDEEEEQEESVEDEEEASEEEEEGSEEEQGSEEEEEDGVETPASRRSSSAVSSTGSAPKSAKSTKSTK